MIYNCENLSFQILTVDRYYHRDGCFDVKARPYAALSYRVRGTGDFEIGTKRFSTKPGDILFLPANTPYKVEYSVSESIVVHFDACNYTEIESICALNGSKIDLCFEHLLEAWKARRSIHQAKSIVYDILDKISIDQQQAISDAAVATCVRYMEEHYFDPELNVEALCDISFVSVSSLQRAFLKCLATSPKQYLNRLRMNRALELLAKNELSVKEISSACGFKDEKYFSRAFRKRYGHPPAQLKDYMFV
ncbi:MAG: helix-turn-helix transcriptional regulator [Clostridia bacterium]|nr:helix-turn-helix transcriptional regulator [Clostridia bacterium]